MALQARLAVSAESEVSGLIDAVAPAAAGVHHFLRAAWFRAATAGASVATLTSRRPCGEPIAAIPLVSRRFGPLKINEVPGSYWPFRSFPLSPQASDAELAELLGDAVSRATLGPIWRLGPVYADDPTLVRLERASDAIGLHVLKRRLGTCYVIDLERRLAEGPWPSVKTLRKNRWCERRLAELGALDFQSISGAGWSDEVLEILASIEAESWVAKTPGGDTKFLHQGNRRIWSEAIQDPTLAIMLRCSILRVGGSPAAFTFSVESGGVRHYIANSYSEHYAKLSAGRMLLYRDFGQAAEAGISRICWGAGDPGYKQEMGAEPGPDIVDCLIVRGRLLSAGIGKFWGTGR